MLPGEINKFIVSAIEWEDWIISMPKRILEYFPVIEITKLKC